MDRFHILEKIDHFCQKWGVICEKWGFFVKIGFQLSKMAKIVILSNGG